MILIDSLNETHTYPSQAYEVAERSIPIYRKISSVMTEGNFTDFTANSNSQTPPLMLSSAESNLFNEKHIAEYPMPLELSIIAINKETLTGKARIPSLPKDIPFYCDDSITAEDLIQALGKPTITASVIRHISYKTFTPKVKKIEIIEISQPYIYIAFLKKHLMSVYNRPPNVFT